jgi:hypothetical protein
MAAVILASESSISSACLIEAIHIPECNRIAGGEAGIESSKL